MDRLGLSEKRPVSDMDIECEFVRERRQRILIVEDDLSLRPLLDHLIKRTSPLADPRWVSSEEAAEKLLRASVRMKRPFDIVIADVFLAGPLTGIDLWRHYGEGETPFLLISSVSPLAFSKMVGDNEAPPFFLQKPLIPRQCIETLSTILNLDSSRID